MSCSQQTLRELFSSMDRFRRSWANLGIAGETSPAQFASMMHIAYGASPWLHTGDPPNRGVSLSTLARLERHSLPASSRRISQLEESGLVRRESVRGDRRVTRIFLTDAGLAMLKRERQMLGRRVAQGLDCLGEEKALTLISLINELADSLDQTAPKPTPER